MGTDVPEGFERITLGPGFSDRFGPVYLHSKGGRLGFRMAEHHLNPVGGSHGGALATFADMQIAAVRPYTGDKADHLPTINLSIDYLAPAGCGAWVEAAVTLVKETRTLVFVQALITADGDLIARVTGIYRNNRRTPNTGGRIDTDTVSNKMDRELPSIT